MPDSSAPSGRPLSTAQLPIWRAEVLHRHTSRWTQMTVVRLRGPVDPERLERAVAAVIERHPALRTRVRVQHGRAMQWFAGEEQFALGRQDRPTAEAGRPGVIEEFLGAAIRDRFTLYNAPLFRADLLTMGPLDRVLALRLHHLAADGIALALIVGQIAAAYRGVLPGAGPDLAYEEWLDRDRQASPKGLEPALLFYRRELAGASRHETLYDRSSGLPAHDPPELPEATVTLDAGACDALRGFARARGATLFIVLFAAYGAMLRAAMGAPDLVIATFVSGRAGEPKPVVGTCINTVLVRLRLGDLATPSDLVAAAKAAWRPVRQHQSVPLMLLSDAAGGSLPLAQFAINYLDMAEAPFELPGVEAAVTHAQQGFPLNDLLLYALREQGGPLRLRLIVGSGTSRLSQARVEALLGDLVGLLRSWPAS